MLKEISVFSTGVVLLAMLIMSTPYQSMACDACSGSVVSYSPNPTYLKKSHAIRLNTDIRLYDITLREGGIPGFAKTFHDDEDNASIYGEDVYYEARNYSYNISGIYYPIENLALTGILPYNQNVLLKEGEVLDNIRGVGDLSLLAQYHLLNGINEESDTAKVGHRLTLGGGIKLPTGRFNEAGYDGIVEPFLQPGSGSVDFPFTLQYIFMVKGFGITSNWNWKVNTVNRNGFKFANTLNTSLAFFYSKSVKWFNITPSTGLNLDHGGKAKMNGELYEKDTGGNLLSCFYGVDMSFQNFGLNFNYYLPVYQKLDGDQFESRHRFAVSLRYVFKKKNSDVNL